MGYIFPIFLIASNFVAKFAAADWYTWIEKCDDAAAVNWSGGWNRFEDDMLGRMANGYHMVAGDYDPAANVYMSAYRKLSGDAQIIEKNNWDDFWDTVVQSMEDGYTAEALIRGDNRYIAWMRESGGDKAVVSRSQDTIVDTMKEYMDDGYGMTSALGNGGVWMAFFREFDSPKTRGSQYFSKQQLHTGLNEEINSDRYVTAMANDGGAWLTWYEHQDDNPSKWKTEDGHLEMYDWIVDNWQGYCITALTQG